MKQALLRSGIGAAVLVASVWGMSAPQAAEQYPTKNVTVIVPYTAGGSADLMTRTMAQRLGEAWGVNMVIDNRPGASGMIGTEIVTKAAPDGYTLLGHTSSFPATAAVRAKLPFDPATAIVPLGTTARAPMLLAINPHVPAKSVKDLINYAKKNPGKLTYGSSGAGGNNHFSGALFAAAAGVKMTHVPYKGISNAVTALAGGEVDIVISSSAALLPMSKANKVRILGVSSLEPSPLFPGVPTIASQGAPGYEYQLWWGLFGPAGMSAERIAFINAAMNKVLASAEMKKFLANQDAEPWPQTAAQIKDMLPREIARYKKAAEVAGIKPL